MNPVYQNIIDDYHTIHQWVKTNEYGIPVKLESLINKVRKAHYISSDNSKSTKYLGLFASNILTSQTFIDEHTNVKNFEYDDSGIYALHIRENEYLIFVDYGYSLVCRYARTNSLVTKYVYTVDQFKSLIAYKDKVYGDRAKEIIRTAKKNGKQCTELGKKIRTVELANSLMEIFGLYLTEESKQKVEEWKQEYENLSLNSK